MKKVLKVVAIVTLILLIAGGCVYMVYLRPFMQKMKQTTTIHYDKDLTIVLGGGGNSGILVSDSLVIVIDTKMDKAADEFYKRVKEIAGSKPILVVNTHIHPDHTGGNKNYSGQTIIAGGNYTAEEWKKENGAESLPTKFLKDRMDIPMGDDTATILNLHETIHTPSDVMVYLHRRKLLFTGDVILNKQAPVLMGVANPDGYLEAMDGLPKQFDIQKIVPGHGEIGGMEILNTFKQYFIDMKIAAENGDKEDELVAKYKDWNQVPWVMSPGATVRFIRDKNNK
jgi:glyoxylase-like metal-dependent hydrolase (beta-lactamase superfamily II)